MRLVLSFLGPFQVTLDNQPAHFATDRARALLAYLAVEADRPHRREALAALIWPDQPEALARRNLSQALVRLRRAIGDYDAPSPFLIITGKTIQFNRSTAELDVAQFEALLVAYASHSHLDVSSCPPCLERLEKAAALYQGEFLQGLFLADSQLFEEWALLKREQLHRRALDVLNTLTVHYREGGSYDQAGRYARRQLALEPWREEAHRQLMRALALSGQRGAALAQYGICCRVLADELGVEPGPETTALYQRIRGGDLSRRAGSGQGHGSETNASISVQPDAPSLLPPFAAEDVAAQAASTNFVGRTRELARLHASLATTTGGHGQFLFVTGGAGRGKTTLVQQFARQAQAPDPDLIVVSGYGNAHTGVGDPYLPFRQALALLAGDVEAKWAGGLMTPQHARRLWEAMPVTLPALVEHAPDLIGSFISAEATLDRATTFVPADVPWLAQLTKLTARDQVARLEEKYIFSQYTAVLKAIAAQRPLILILEDLHWVDAASNGLLFHLSRELDDSRVMVIGTYRPDELVAGWNGERHPLAGILGELKRHYGDIWLDLGELSSLDERHFVDAYLDAQPNRLGEGFRQALFHHTGGHALFVAELLRDMQERGDLRRDEDGCWVEGETVDWQTLPAKVEGVIETRLERLEPSLHSLLSVAGVEGEYFTAEVVARVQGLDERVVVQRLSRELDKGHRLVRAQALERVGRQRISCYRFRHHLFQHYLYHHLDATERAYLHQEVGVALEALYGDQTAQAAVQLARHFERAGLFEKAIDYLLQAGEGALRLSAVREATGHIIKALELSENLPPSLERDRQELRIQIMLAFSLVTQKGYGDEDVERAYRRAHQLSEKVDESVQLGFILYGLFSYYSFRAEYELANQVADRLLALGDSLDDPPTLAVGHQSKGIAAFLRGDLAAGLEHAQQSYQIADPLDSSAFFQFGGDFQAYTSVWVALAQCLMGFPDQARTTFEAGLGMTSQQPYAHSFVLCFASIPQLLHDLQETLRRADELIRLADKYSFVLLGAIGTINRGWALALTQKTPEPVQDIQNLLPMLRSVKIDSLLPWYLSLCAEAQGAVGRLEDALQTLDEAFAYAEEAGGSAYLAELHRLKGQLLLMGGAETLLVRSHLEQAVDVARQNRARWWELRATVDLCRLLRSQDKYDEARKLLSAVYHSFSEGFDTPDLIQARALLDKP